MHYAFIGLGELGAPLAMRLLGAGLSVTVHDRDAARAAPLLAAGAAWADGPAEAAAAADHAITVLPSPAASEAVLDAMLPHLGGKDWIEMSTLSRDVMRALAARAGDAGAGVLELPVTGGVHLAASGQLALLAGGDAETLARHVRATDAMGRCLHHMGGVGDAALIKVITNMLAFVHLKACGEALMLAGRGGLDLGQAWRAIRDSSGTSFVHETEGALVLNGSCDVGFSIDLARKDLGFALAFGQEFGVPLELAEATARTYDAAHAAYGGGAQSPMIVRLLEDALGTPLRAEGFPARLAPGTVVP